MLVSIVLGSALVVGLIAGGRLGNVRSWSLRATGVGLLAYAAQALMFTRWGTDWLGEWTPIAYMVTLFGALVFLLLNRRVTGVSLLLAGLLLNVLVISANGGRMPASTVALGLAGHTEAASLLGAQGILANCTLMSSGTRFNILGDWIVIRLTSTAGSAYSIGDMVAMAGGALLVFGMVRGKSDSDDVEEAETRPVA
jgi:hypothetical protein